MELIEASKVHEAIIDYRDKATDAESEIELERAYGANDVGKLISQLPVIEAIPKDQYEARLKADLKAILVELQLEIEEQRQDNPEFNIWKDGYNTANDIDCVIIQQKIDKLKEQNNEP